MIRGWNVILPGCSETVTLPRGPSTPERQRYVVGSTAEGAGRTASREAANKQGMRGGGRGWFLSGAPVGSKKENSPALKKRRLCKSREVGDADAHLIRLSAKATSSGTPLSRWWHTMSMSRCSSMVFTVYGLFKQSRRGQTDRRYDNECWMPIGGGERQVVLYLGGGP